MYFYYSSFLIWMHTRGSFYTYETGATFYRFARHSV